MNEATVRPSPTTGAATLMVHEVFYSIQGESTWSGRPCVFIRLMGCHLRCGYCDTEHAFYAGRRRAIDDIVDEVDRIGHGCRLAEITGGEPLLQPGAAELMRRLCDRGHTVLVETSGACEIRRCDPRAVRIMDVKTPGSGEVDRNHWPNLDELSPWDEVKFVLTGRADYEWARDVIRDHRLAQRVRAVLLSPAHHVPPGEELSGSEGLSIREVAEWMLADGIEAQLQTQLHKLIWDPQARGV